MNKIGFFSTKPLRLAKIFIILFMLILIIGFTQLLGATIFSFDDDIGDIYIINSYVRQKVLLDERVDGEYEFKYEGRLEVVDKLGTSSKLIGYYNVYNKPYNSSESYQLINEKSAETSFIRRKNGEMIIDKSYLYPTVRDVPIFPEYDIKIGYEWKAKALEILNLSTLGAKNPYKIPLDVSYKYLNDEIYQEKLVAVFSVKYYFEYDLYEKPNPNSEEVRPIYITGLFEGKYYWDKKTSTPLFYDAKSIYVYLLKNSEVLEIRSLEYGEVIKEAINKEDESIDEVDNIRKEEITNDIEKELAEKQLDDDFDVLKKDEGVAINLGDVLFDFNSSKLKPEATEKLDEIVKILKRYENFKMKIEGHTDNIGNEKVNQKLSEDRANTVKDYLILKGVKPNSLSAEGFGEKHPISTNDTEEGKALNRRVEIIIITNKN